MLEVMRMMIMMMIMKIIRIQVLLAIIFTLSALEIQD